MTKRQIHEDKWEQLFAMESMKKGMQGDAELAHSPGGQWVNAGDLSIRLQVLVFVAFPYGF